jgi:hypothetical protein
VGDRRQCNAGQSAYPNYGTDCVWIDTDVNLMTERQLGFLDGIGQERLLSGWF